MWIYSPVSQMEDTVWPKKRVERPSQMSSNSSKKKQDEKYLKILRDFMALPCNKNCFDCNQRGPTYVNTTIGSFVCVSCSGRLRGLTPPHRVKSVTMSSFTPEEIEFIKSRGNEYSRHVWMSHYDIADLTAETKDEHRFRDHLVAKYERKRWYADPSTIADRLPKMNVGNGEASTAVRVRTPTPTTHSPVARPSAQPASNSMPISKSSDLLAELDFFGGSAASASSAFSPGKVNSSVPQSLSQPSFANFQNADFFFTEPAAPKVNPTPFASPPAQPVAANGLTSPPKGSANGAAVPPEDRYSALKDLDVLFTSQSVQNETSTTAPAGWTPSWSAAPAQATLPNKSESVFSKGLEAPNAWNAAFAPSTHSNNPFLAAAPLPPVTQPVHYGQPVLPWANFGSSPSTAAVSTAPLGAGSLFPPAAASQYSPAFGFNSNPVNIGTTLTTSQSLDLSPKTWGSSSGMNPFMDTATSFNQGRSHNPFL